MTDAVITEFAGTRQGDRSRAVYQYGNGGVRVLDGKKNAERLYLFDPSANIMTERDPSRQDKILRRFVFDPLRHAGRDLCVRPAAPDIPVRRRCPAAIAVREGGDYGAVGKLFTFEENGVSETGWGRNGEIERVFVFESGDDAITERAGGWFGNVDRTIVFEGIRASVFREPESFLQFLMFTEWSDSDRESQISDEVEKIRAGEPGVGRRSPVRVYGPTAYDGRCRGSPCTGPGPRVPGRNGNGRPARASRSGSDDGGIDFIPDADAPPSTVAPRSPGPEERRHPVRRAPGPRGPGDRPAFCREECRDSHSRNGLNVPARNENPFQKGGVLKFPSMNGSGVRGRRSSSPGGGSVDIPLEERFEDSRREREKVSKGKSAEIPYSERRGGGDR